MDLTRIPLFEALAKRMAWLNQRQTVLAQNVANADTPGYAAQDLRQPDFSALVKGTAGPLKLAATEAGHLQPREETGGFERVTTPGERSLNGNGVSLEAQMMKVSDTAADYALTANLYRAQLGLLKTAIGDGGNGG